MKKEQKSPSYDLKFGSYFFASEMNISLMNFTKLDLNLPISYEYTKLLIKYQIRSQQFFLKILHIFFAEIPILAKYDGKM